MRQIQDYQIRIQALTMRLTLSATYVYNSSTWQNLKLQVKLGTEFTKTMPQGKGSYGSKKGRPKKKGLYANIAAKKKRIAAGSGEKMRKAGDKGAPTASDFKKAAKTAKKKKK